MIKRTGYKKTLHDQDVKDKIDLNLCGWCGKEKPLWERTTRYTCCSTECTHEFYKNCVTYTWREVREKAFYRDGFKCKICNEIYQDHQLIGDHITPIALGGPEFDLNNVQTLCISCNKTKTRNDIKKIARQRIINKALTKHNLSFFRN